MAKWVNKTFPVLEMSCAACAGRVEKILRQQPGVTDAVVNFAASTVLVGFDPDVTSAQKLRSAIQEGGYDMLTDTGEEGAVELETTRAGNYRKLKRRTTWAILLSIPIVIIGMFGMNMPYADWIMWALATPVVFWLGRGFFIQAWKQLRHRSANMDTLVALSTGIAYLFSLFNLFFPEFWLSRGVHPHVYFEAASVIIAFILLGRLLEERAKGNTSSAIKKLMGLQPKTVTLVRPDGSLVKIPVKDIRVGDVISVRPGEKIAVDGMVVDGSSFVDESMLSGEPVAVRKEKDAKVFAGTINQKGNLRFRAEKVGSDTLLAQIIRMVQDAQGSKAPVQKLTDKLAGIFVPVIIGIALLAFILWVALDADNEVTHGILAFVTVLIIACPCALGLATPTAIMVGIGKGAENGILIKDAESLETARKVDTVVLDKTGTVTEGRPVITDLFWLHDHRWQSATGEEQEVISDHAREPIPDNKRKLAGDYGRRSASERTLQAVFYSLEKQSEHPLADAVATYFENTEALPVDRFESVTGLGVTGVIDGKVYWAGNRKLLDENGISVDPVLFNKAEALLAEAKTVIWFADGEKALAVAAISDRIKASSVAAVRELRAQRIEVYMLTGDNPEAAGYAARMAGIGHFRAEALPQDKAEFVKEWQAQGHIVAMAGDGINDSAALAQADLSIAMGKGSDIAMDVAGITIISSDLTKIPEAIRLSQLTVRTVRQNLFWAFIYNLIGVPLAAGILYPVNGFLLNPMIAGAAMALSSVSVVANSLRLKRKKLSRKVDTNDILKPIVMKKDYRIDGMNCNHCRTSVEKALNMLDGVTASVTLDPPVASVEFTGEVLPLSVLQQKLSEAGDFTISEK